MEVKETELSKSLSIIYQPHPVVPVNGRQELVGVIEEGTTVREILLKAGVDPYQPIIISLDDRMLTVEEWDTVCPSNGQILNVQASVEGGGGDSNPLQIVLAIALVVVAATLPGLGPALFSIGSTSITVGTIAAAAIAVGGSLLLTALFPPKTPSDVSGRGEEVSPTYSLSGGSNQVRPYQSMPVVMGTHRIFPDAASRPYTEYRGDDQYLYQIFNLGLGAVSVSDWKIGTTPITSYADATLIYQDANGRIPAFPGNVDSIAGAALTYAAGWITRTTSENTYRIGIDIEAIVFRVDEKGNFKPVSVDVEVQYAVAGSGVWEYAPTNDYYFPAATPNSPGVWRITGSTQKPQRGTLYINVPVGQYDVRVRRNALDENEDTRVVWTTNYSTLRSYQEDNLTYKGQNRVGLEIRASEQLNGVVQQLSVTVSASATYWNGSAWVFGQTSNPAHWFMHFARGVYNLDGKLMYGIGLSESQLDLAALHVWAQFCDAEGLTFNAIIDGSQTAADIINIIAKAGFGSPTWASGKLGVVFDAKNASPVMTFGMSNIIRNSFEVAYITEQLSDEIVVRFRNPDKDWEQDEVRVTVPGVTDPLSPASIELFGCTNATMAGKFANYLAAQQYYRKRRITWQTDFEGFVCQRGDVVLLSHDLTQWGYSGRIVNTSGLQVTLDRKVPRSAGGDYLMLIRPDGQTFTYDISGGTGETDVLTLQGSPNFQAGYEVYDHRWCYSPLSTSGKKVKIISVAPASDSRLQIVATDEYPEFYDSWGGTFVPPPDTTVLPAQPVTITNLQAVSRAAYLNGYLRNRVTLSWGTGGGTLYAKVKIFFDGNLVAEQAQNLTRSYEIDFEGAGTFYAEVTPYGVTGAGITQTTTLGLSALDFPSAPASVTLSVGENAQSATYTWEEVLGAQSYIIAVYVSGVEKRRVNVGNTLSYTYTVEDAKADGGAFRQYEFRVYAANQVGQSTGYASVNFSNPQIGALANVSLNPLPLSLNLTYTKPSDADFAGVQIWISTDTNFTPGLATLVYDGIEDSVAIEYDAAKVPLVRGTTYFIYVAGYDTFGKDNLTLSAKLFGSITAIPWTSIETAVTEDVLDAGLRDRIDLIDTSGAADFPNGLIEKVRLEATNTAVLDDAVDTIGEKLLESALKIQDNTDLLYDAGVTVDSTTGEVYIFGLREAQNEINEVGIRLDAAEASITLKASTSYVDQAIANAVIDPSQIAELDDIYARLTTAEIDIDGLDAAITLKADLLLVENQGARLSTAEIDIDALQSEIVLKATNTELDATEARVTTVETTLNALDVPSITQSVKDVKYLSKAGDQIAETQLKDILTGQANYEDLDYGIAVARQDLTAYTDAKLLSEATARTELAATLANTQAALVQESITRATTDSAEATARLALTARVDVAEGNISATQSAITTESITRASADEALATQVTTISAQATKTRTYRQTTAPTIGMVIGDLWFDTDDSNKPYRYDGSQWVATDDTRIEVNAAAIQTESETRATADSALATSITTLQTTVGSNTTSIQTNAESIDGINAKYTVKIDNNGYISGYGLISTANTGTPTSSFYVLADKFGITSPTDTSPTLNPEVPFFVLTTTQTIDGKTLAPGVYIKKGNISTIDAETITTGFLSANRIAANSITAGKIDTRSLDIKDAAGNVIFSSTGVVGSGNIAKNSDFLISSGGSPTNYVVYNNAAVSVTTSVNDGAPIAGAKYWRIQANSAGSTTFGFYFNTAADLFGGWKANTNYIVSFYARSNGIAGAKFFDAWNQPPAVRLDLQNPGISGAWQRYVWRINFGNNAIDSGGFWSVNQTVPPGVYLDIACVSVEQGDTPSGWMPASLTTLNKLTTGNITTFIDGAAIGNAQIGTLDAGKINTGTLDADRIAASSITAGKLSVSTLSAISADLGTMTAGSISAGMIRSNTSGTFNGGTFSLGNSTSINGFLSTLYASQSFNGRSALIAEHADSSTSNTQSSAGVFINFARQSPALLVVNAVNPFVYSVQTSTGIGYGRVGITSTYGVDISTTEKSRFSGAIQNAGAYGAAFGAAGNLGQPLTEGYVGFVGSGGLFRYYSGATVVKQISLAISSYAAYSGSGEGKFYAVDGVGPFTGFHDGLVPDDSEIQIGDILFDVDVYEATDINSVTFYVDATTTANKKGVIGVCSQIYDTPPDDWLSKIEPPKFDENNQPIEQEQEQVSFVPEGYKVVNINALGEGQINVCGLGGDIEKGDLIVSSSIRGKGMKQDDDIVRSYTVAKSRVNVTFDYPEQVKMIPCIYICG